MLGESSFGVMASLGNLTSWTVIFPRHAWQAPPCEFSPGARPGFLGGICTVCPPCFSSCRRLFDCVGATISPKYSIGGMKSSSLILLSFLAGITSATDFRSHIVCSLMGGHMDRERVFQMELAITPVSCPWDRTPWLTGANLWWLVRAITTACPRPWALLQPDPL